jgi:hypothetical protein
MTAIVSSPASSGPAGSQFEAQVGAYYLLSLLTGSEPRGLPGTIIDSVEFQRAAEGRPLDDIIIHAHDARGTLAVLEIQVKRSITFAPSDPVFRKVVGQIVEASRLSDFQTSRYELAIAIARTSRKIDGSYQDVLTWARQIGDATTFMVRIDRPGSANDDMRVLVGTFKSHLRDFGAPDDDVTVWRLLRRLQILVFDFTAEGSASEYLAKERAVRALRPDDALSAGNLWAMLIELALQIAASGGDRTRDRLIADLRRQPFQLAGDRRFASTRAALAEASHNALSDIGDQVDSVSLTRHERVSAVHAALDDGRYIEIRGEAGVGKSALLKHFAEQYALEGQIVILSPGRTIPRGWTAMQSVLGFNGTAYDLLSDLAGSGGAILFIDNLDFFAEEEQNTVIDLLREAAKVPGFAVIATARRNFGTEEPSWLPSDALDSLGRAEPIVIGELSKAEVEELRHAAPGLAPLLSETHPARKVTRNLFRLARLASRPGNGPSPRTEVDMAEQWWQTADGKLDGERRVRARLLKALAEQLLSGTEPLSVVDRPAKAVDALIASETLRDLDNDRVAFRHDTLREWAIANLLSCEPSAIEQLPLERPAPVSFARGVELAARMAIERADDSTRWKWLLDRFSRDGIHSSWRRAVMMALVRSEIGTDLLSRASDLLLTDRAKLLRELIRFMLAIEVESATKIFVAAGIDPSMIPSMNVPSGQSWQRMIIWLLSLEEPLPTAAIPDVVELYTTWSSGLFGQDSLTPYLLMWLYFWLTKIESVRDPETLSDQHNPFRGEFDRERISSLESYLRNGFLMFCNRTPELAVEYLQSLAKRRHNDNTIRSILMFRGALAQAAPAELADLTKKALIPRPRADERDYRDELREPFDFIDHTFYPASPAQGPFLELLTHSPQHGLSLIHQLVNHAITFYTSGRDYGANAFTITFPDGERDFPWKSTYFWSREGQAPSCVTSCMMALETWAHRRIEAGEAIDEVLADVLGPPGSPAAYLLVAVDILLSHRPKSREAAVPFLACPELLCIDRERLLHDNFEYPDILGFKALQKESPSAASLESLKKRDSRQLMLDNALGQYVLYGPVEQQEKLTVLLRNAADRLGPPDEQSNLADPAFMAVHALNQLDQNNYPLVTVTLPDGTQKTGRQYVSPEAESRHFASLQKSSQNRVSDDNMQVALGLALEDPSQSSPEFAEAAVKWAQTSVALPEKSDNDEGWIREHAIITAAMIAMRDGDSELRKQHAEWARKIFAQALQTKKDLVHQIRLGIRFNPIAIAFVGMTHEMKDRANIEDIRALLDVAASDNPASAHGLNVVATIIANIDERLPRAILRCAFAASIRPRREWDLPEEEVTARSERYLNRVRAAVDAELGWLSYENPEPEWPVFPSEPVRLRWRVRIPGGEGQTNTPESRCSRPDEYVNHQVSALWLTNTKNLYDVFKRPWLRDVSQAYRSWTATANGAGLNAHDDVDQPPREWNESYFNLLANCLPGLTLQEINDLSIESINSLPDDAFFDVMTEFLRSVDDVYFNNYGINDAVAISIRSDLAHRMMESSGWKRMGGSRSASIEMRIGPAIATLFFNNYDYGKPPNCYLFSKGIDRLGSFLCTLEKLVESGPSLYIAMLVLNLIEVSPRPEHLQFIIAAGNVWMKSYPDGTFFWVDQEIGRRTCAFIEEIWRQEPTLIDAENAVRLNVERLLAALISLGVADAKRLEVALWGESEG